LRAPGRNPEQSARVLKPERRGRGIKKRRQTKRKRQERTEARQGKIRSPADLPRDVQRNHAEGYQSCIRNAVEGKWELGRCAAGSSSPRPHRGLQSFSALVEQSAARSFCRPRANCRAPIDRLARKGKR